MARHSGGLASFKYMALVLAIGQSQKSYYTLIQNSILSNTCEQVQELLLKTGKLLGKG